MEPVPYVTLTDDVHIFCMGWTIGVIGFDSRTGAGNFSLYHRVQNDSEAHSVSYSVGTRGSSLGVKLTIHLRLEPRSKNAWSYTFTPPIRLHGVVLS